MQRLGLQSGVFVSVRDAIIGGGGALLSATSGQTGLQLLGLAAIIFGFGHILWGITLDGRQWWKPKLATTPEWVPLHAALSYMVSESIWSENQEPVKVRFLDSAEFDQLVSTEFRERLARSEIQSRGIKGKFEKQTYRVTETIPARFWIDAFFQPYAEIDMKDDNRGVATKNGGGGPSYRGIILRKDQLELAWPRKRKMCKWSDLIPNSTAS